MSKMSCKILNIFKIECIQIVFKIVLNTIFFFLLNIIFKIIMLS